MHRKDREDPPYVTVLHGPTGSGKTRRAFEHDPELWSYPGSGWFDGYYGQATVLFDDFSGSEFKITFLLRLLDRYPMQVPVKGGFTWWAPEQIFITSNLSPDRWYPNAHIEHVRALQRRFSEVTLVNLN